MILFASAPQREQHDFKTEQLSFSASNSIWPIVYIYIPRPNPSPAFPMMPQQMPDTEVESKQLFPLPHCCIILRNLHSFFSPRPPLPHPCLLLSLPLPSSLPSPKPPPPTPSFKIKKPSPDFCLLQFIRLQVLSYQDHWFLREA